MKKLSIVSLILILKYSSMTLIAGEPATISGNEKTQNEKNKISIPLTNILELKGIKISGFNADKIFIKKGSKDSLKVEFSWGFTNKENSGEENPVIYQYLKTRKLNVSNIDTLSGFVSIDFSDSPGLFDSYEKGMGFFGRLKFWIRGTSGVTSTDSLVIYVPENCKIITNNKYCDYYINDLKNNLEFSDVNGELNIQKLNGNLNVNGNMDIKLNDFNGNSEINSSYGILTLSNGNGDLKIENDYGEISVTDWNGKIEVDAESSKMSLKNLKTGRMDFEGDYSDITVENVTGLNMLSIVSSNSTLKLRNTKAFTYRGKPIKLINMETGEKTIIGK